MPLQRRVTPRHQVVRPAAALWSQGLLSTAAGAAGVAAGLGLSTAAGAAGVAAGLGLGRTYLGMTVGAGL